MLTDRNILQLYAVTKYLRLTCDASEYGLGCVLSHIVNGEENPIAFVSRSLSRAERKYGEIEKEALSIVFGVKKISQVLLSAPVYCNNGPSATDNFVGP